MLHIRTALQNAIAQNLETLFAPHITSEQALKLSILETPKLSEHGDFSCIAAMQLAKPLRQNPRTVAQTLREHLLGQSLFEAEVESLEIAGPGFLNIVLKPTARQRVVQRILQEKAHFGYQAQNGKNVLVEFVSANPTGPLHVGHGRQAALGDAICNLYATQGWKAVREFYYNDAGVQIHNLALSVQARAKGLQPGDALWPENAYNGEYIADIAQAFLAKQTVQADDRSYQGSGVVEDLDSIRLFAVAYLRHEQDLDLQAFGLRFDQYFLESSLYTNGSVERTVASLVANGHTYESEGALWLRTTDEGDDKDRVMRKGDGQYTYFVPDVAYHQNKWDRGFAQAINVQGSDHHGTIARVRAGLQALDVGIPVGYPDYVLHTMVRVQRQGEEIKLSKRAGSYVTLRDLIEWTSADAVRFFLLSRKPDTQYIFDIDLALQQNNDNPVYYVQYAHARICSVLRAWEGDETQLLDVDLHSLDSAAAQALLRVLEKYPSMLSMAARDVAPHDVVFYLRELAASYHSYYDAERILVEDRTQREARLALVAACAQVLRNGLGILGVSAPNQM